MRDPAGRRHADPAHPARTLGAPGEVGVRGEPVRQGRRRRARAAQARRARGADAVGDAPLPRPGQRHRRCTARRTTAGRRGELDRLARPPTRRCPVASATDGSTSHAIPGDDPATYELIRSTHSVGMFQIESPGQRELLGRLQPDRFGDLVTEISLFRPGPVKADMVSPVRGPPPRRGGLRPRPPGARAGARRDLRRDRLPRAGDGGAVGAHRVRPRLRRPAAAPAVGRAQAACDARLVPVAARRTAACHATTAEKVWDQLASFASFGFCKAHAAAFAVPTVPVGVPQGPRDARVPRRAAHPRPGDVPAPDDPRRGPAVRHRGPASGRQPLPRARTPSRWSTGGWPTTCSAPPRRSGRRSGATILVRTCHPAGGGGSPRRSSAAGP